jgi:AcrR family transcriptional regulator
MAVELRRKRVTKSREDRRQDLLDAAVKVFEAKGISEATVADITEAAGVAKGTFYLYFDSKEHLLAALREQFVDEMVTKGMGYLERVGKEDWWSLVDSVVESSIDHMIERRDVIHIFNQEPLTSETHAIFAECEAKMNQLMAAGIQMGVDAGVFKVSDPLMTATFLHHAIEGSVLEAIIYGGELDRERLVESAKELTHKLLAA